MQQQDLLFFRFCAGVGVFLKAFFIGMSDLMQIQAQSFTHWLFPFLLHLLELGVAGLVTGFFGTLGKKIYERKFGDKKKKVALPEE